MSIIDENYINLIDESIDKTINNTSILHSKLYESIKYSLFSGGKRIRPLLCIKAYELFKSQTSIEKIMPFAVSMEFIHTYSLIHDDLPSMDNDDLRRGKPTNHKVFGEGFAILAGDALLNLAFENMLEFTSKNCISLEDYKLHIKAMEEISKYAGCGGMIGGQAIDLMNESKSLNEDGLISMYRAKTSGLIEASLVAGAIIGGANNEEIEALRNFGLNLGLAFQIRDDILDLEEDEEIEKFTYLNYHNKDKAKDEVERLSLQAIKSIEVLNNRDNGYFIDLTKRLSTRDK